MQLAGCASVDIRAGGGAVTGTTTQAQVSTGSTVGTAIIVGILVADSARYFFRGPDRTRTPIASPASAHGEHAVPPRVSVQDCTRPVDPTAGNLFCRSPQARH